MRKFDKKRKGKKVSNDDWHSPSDPDSRITKMKNGDTHLAYKAEHAVDLETEMVVAAQIYQADQGDSETLADTLIAAQENLADAGSEQNIEEVVADKGYHSADTVAGCAEAGIRTYILDRSRSASDGGRTSRKDSSKPCTRTGDGAGARRQTASAMAQRTGGAQLRARLRDGRSEAQLDSGPPGGDQALPDSGRRAQPGDPHAEALRDRHAEEPAGLLARPSFAANRLRTVSILAFRASWPTSNGFSDRNRLRSSPSPAFNSRREKTTSSTGC